MTKQTGSVVFFIRRLIPLSEKQYMRFPISFRTFARNKRQWIPICSLVMEVAEVGDEKSLEKYLFNRFGEGVFAGFGYRKTVGKMALTYPVCWTKCKFIVRIRGVDVEHLNCSWDMNKMHHYFFWHSFKYQRWGSMNSFDSNKGDYKIQNRSFGVGVFRW